MESSSLQTERKAYNTLPNHGRFRKGDIFVDDEPKDKEFACFTSEPLTNTVDADV